MKLYGKLFLFSALIASTTQIKAASQDCNMPGLLIMSEREVINIASFYATGAAVLSGMFAYNLTSNSNYKNSISAVAAICVGATVFINLCRTFEKFTPSEKIKNAKKIIDLIASHRLAYNNFEEKEQLFYFLKESNLSFIEAINVCTDSINLLDEVSIILKATLQCLRSNEKENFGYTAYAEYADKLIKKIEYLNATFEKYLSLLKPFFKEILFKASSDIKVISEHPLAQEDFKYNVNLLESILTTNSQWPLALAYDECTKMLTALRITNTQLKEIFTILQLSSQNFVVNEIERLSTKIDSLSKILSNQATILQQDPRFYSQWTLYQTAIKKAPTVEFEQAKSESNE